MRDINSFPKSVTRNSKSELKIIWQDDTKCIYNMRILRLECRCALCRHEITGERLIKAEDIPQDIDVLKIEQVGNYGFQFLWSDNHNTGIYSFDQLKGLC